MCLFVYVGYLVASTPALGVTAYTNIYIYINMFFKGHCLPLNKQKQIGYNTQTNKHTHIHEHTYIRYIRKRGAEIRSDKNRHSCIEVEVLVATAINSKACAASNGSSTTTTTTAIIFVLSQKQGKHTYIYVHM